MPTYGYECRECGYSFERVQNMSDEPVRDCPECGKAVRRIIFGGSGVIFKGNGFYVNDSKGKNPAAPANGKSTGSESSSDSPASAAPKKENPSAAASATSPSSSGGTNAQSGSKPAGESGGRNTATKEKA
ncbi:MAG: FmdB family transcriptional regulator [Spirochaetae bacterium HGW-Spirochaetae-7]|nr:MAG: FmdB family transcriptional regulator [Spirochaetae bacterium HGW-Spirochaetae-7]